MPGTVVSILQVFYLHDNPIKVLLFLIYKWENMRLRKLGILGHASLKVAQSKFKARAIWIQSSCFDLYAIKIAPYKYKWVIQKINLGISTKEDLRRNSYLWFIRNSAWSRLSSSVWNFRRESPWNIKLYLYIWFDPDRIWKENITTFEPQTSPLPIASDPAF